MFFIKYMLWKYSLLVYDLPLFIFLMESFEEETFLILVKSNFLIFV